MKIKKTILTIVLIPVLMFAFWLGGCELKRGDDLIGSLIASVILAWIGANGWLNWLNEKE